MTAIPRIYLSGAVVEDSVHLTLVELCQACRAEEQHVLAWVSEGIVAPLASPGQAPAAWRFSGSSLGRVRLAQRLAYDLEINPPGVALALDLLDQIAVLQSHLQRASAR